MRRPDPQRLRAALADARARLTPRRGWRLPPLPARTDPRWRRFLPILTWAPAYRRDTLENDAIAALIVTLMLIPQSLAYALLAGLPAEVGLYASIAPLLIYAVFGSSRTLAVGPVAVVSLMTAAAIAPLAAQGSPEYLGAAVALACLSGLILLAMGALRLGFLAGFLSHPVISGFITASGLLIAAAQVRHLLGLPGGGDTLPKVLGSLWANLGSINLPTLALGVFATGFLVWARQRLKPWLRARGLNERPATIIARAGPVLAIIATTFVTWALGLAAQGVKVVGDIPAGLPRPALPPLDLGLWAQIALPALMISIVGYVETISVAQTLAAKRRQRIDPDQELIALGAANLGAGLSGGYPVTGGFARSVVNFDAGAETPAAGALTALGMAAATVMLTPLLFYLPQATLAATIIVAVLTLVDFGAIARTWAYARADGLAVIVTIAATLGLGVEDGIAAGVALSIALHLYRSARPHVAVVGQVPGTEHFRNIARHRVATSPAVLSIRIDENLFFANARFLEDTIYDRVAADPAIRHVVLMCPSVSAIDASALESLEAVNRQLADSGVTLHLSEVKGPVMDRLRRSHLLCDLTGRVFLTQFDALAALSPEVTQATLHAPRGDTAR